MPSRNLPAVGPGIRERARQCEASAPRCKRRHYVFSHCFENGEQTFGRIDAAIYRNTKGDPRALAIAEELSQVGTVRDEIQRIQKKLGRCGQLPRSLHSESPTVETLLRRMDALARQFAEMPREYPSRSEIINEITRLSFLADSLFKSKNHNDEIIIRTNERAHCEWSGAAQSQANKRARWQDGK